MFSTMFSYLSLLLSHFAFSFHLLFCTLHTTRHILQFTMFDSISLQPASKIASSEQFRVHDKRKSVTLIKTKQNILIF